MHHGSSAEHRQALSCSRQQNYMSEIHQQGHRRERRRGFEAPENSIFYRIKRISIDNFRSLLELMELNGVNLKMLGDGYRSRKNADELLEAVGAAIDSTVKRQN